MKIYAAAVAAIGCVQYTSAFMGTTKFASQQSLWTSPLQANHQHHQNDNQDISIQTKISGWVGPISTVVAGLTVASQTVGAVVEPPMVSLPPAIEMNVVTNSRVESQSAPTSFITGTSMSIAADEYLDFSMPSYGSSVESTSKAKPDVSSMSNPFGDFDFSKRGDTPAETKVEEKPDPAAAEAKAKADKEAADKKAADEKARAEKLANDQRRDEAQAKADKEAAEKRKEEEKAAAKQKEADEKAAAEAKKAEKEARRQAEIEKQKALVERQKEKDAAAAAAAAAAKEAATPPPAPAPKPAPVAPPPVVEKKATEMKAPDIKLDIPDFKAPDIKVPAFSMPKIEVPDMPKYDLPDMPKTGGSSAMSTPKFEVPKVSGISMPKIDLAPEVDENMEPQEDRDEKARAARAVYKEADGQAKELEAKAAALRQTANEKKKVAKDAKDEACKTRIGGKVLCIRPLNSGY